MDRLHRPFSAIRAMRASVVAVGLAAGALSGGCHGVQDAVLVDSAAARIEEARATGAEELAPYEYYSAKEHLEQALMEVAAASHSDAAQLASRAEA